MDLVDVSSLDEILSKWFIVATDTTMLGYTHTGQVKDLTDVWLYCWSWDHVFHKTLQMFKENGVSSQERIQVDSFLTVAMLKTR